MSDINIRIRDLELRAAERDLVGVLAADAKLRDAARREARELREEAYKLRIERPRVHSTEVTGGTQYA